MIDISIIIVNYNVKEYIVDCIQSIIRWTPQTIQYEIIVVDNNSQDGSVNALETKFPEITILKIRIILDSQEPLIRAPTLPMGPIYFY